MKTQAQFYNQENATEYWEQYFTSETPKPITLEQWLMIKRLVDEIANVLCKGHNVEVTTKRKRTTMNDNDITFDI